MKVYSLLILLCFLETLICDVEGLNSTLFHKTFNNSIQYLKAFHPDPFYVVLKSSNILSNLRLGYADLNSKNVEFKLDEFGMLHVKYINLKLNLKGQYPSTYRRYYKFYSSFTAELANGNMEQIYGIKYQKLENGKNDIKFGHISDSEVLFSGIKLISSKIVSGSNTEKSLKSLIANLDFTPLKLHLQKVTNVVLDKISSNLK